MPAGDNEHTAAIVALGVGLALLLISSLPRRLAHVHRLLLQHRPSGSGASIASCLCNTSCSSCYFSARQEVGRVVIDWPITSRFQVPVAETSIGAELDVSTAKE